MGYELKGMYVVCRPANLFKSLPQVSQADQHEFGQEYKSEPHCSHRSCSPSTSQARGTTPMQAKIFVEDPIG